MSNPAIIIPARLDSTRFAQKMLAEINGKPLIWWTARAARLTGLEVFVATDCEEIGLAAGVPWAMTGSCQNGTERCIDVAVRVLGDERPMIINWQGDSPLTRPEWALLLAERMKQSPCGVGTLQQFADREALDGEVGVVHGYDSNIAAAFQRVPKGHHLHYRHVGIYAVKREAFSLYGKVPSARELALGLEQMRWQDRGAAIATFTVSDEPAIEVNYPDDLALVEALLESADAID